MEISLPTLGGDACDNFGELNNGLLTGFVSYGYEPSTIQWRMIMQLCKGGNVVMQATSDPGKIATYCSAISQRVSYRLPVVQCLVVAFDFDYVDEIVTAMAALGDQLHVKVKSCTEIYPRKCPPTDAHVLVGTEEDVKYLFEKTSLLDNVKTVVFDGTKFDLMLGLIKLCVQHMVFERNRSVQFGVIFEHGMAESDLSLMKEMLKDPLILLDENPDKLLTLDGITRHQFVAVANDFSKVAALLDIIEESMLKGLNTVIFANCASIKPLAASLLREKRTICTTRKGMNHRDRNAIVEEFLNVSNVLLTSRKWVRDIVGIIYDKVDVIVNYSPSLNPVEYIQRLGWFRGVNAAITLVASPDNSWGALVDLQERHNIVFENKLGYYGHIGPMIRYDANTEKKHFIYSVEVKSGDEMLKLIVKYVIAAGTSVIFVESDEKVYWLIGEMKRQKHAHLVTFIDSVEVFEEMENNNNNNDARVLVTTDDVNNKVKNNKKVILVINYDVPSNSKEDYDHRFDWCQENGVVLYFGTELDWVQILEMQILNKVRLAPLIPNLVDALKLISGSSAEIEEESEDDEPWSDSEGEESEDDDSSSREVEESEDDEFTSDSSFTEVEESEDEESSAAAPLLCDSSMEDEDLKLLSSLVRREE